jgi:hypothetical protein
MALRDAQLGSRVTKAMALRLERGGARAELIIFIMRGFAKCSLQR